MRIRSFKFLSAILIAATLLGCRTRSTSKLQTASTDNPAWFVGANRVITVCLRISPAINQQLRNSNISEEDLQNEVGLTYTRWVEYLSVRGGMPLIESSVADALIASGVQTAAQSGKITANDPIFKIYDHIVMPPLTLPMMAPLEPEVQASMFPLALVFNADCARADLEIDFGVSPTVPALNSESPTMLGYAGITENGTPTWKKGIIQLKDHSGELSYVDLIEPSVALMHEWGHVLGNPHIGGTIMDPEELAQFAKDAKSTRDLGHAARKLLFAGANSIDRWRNLYARTNCPPRDGAEYGMGVCRTGGMGFSDVSGEIVHYYKGPLVRVDFFNLDFFAVLIDGGLPAKGTIEQESSEPKQEEIFQRPRTIVPKPLFYESYVVNNWRSSRYMTKVHFNTNEDRRSTPTEIFAECPGENVTVFQAPVLSSYQMVAPRSWTKSLSTEIIQRIRKAQSCVGDATDFSHLSDDNQLQKTEEAIAALKQQTLSIKLGRDKTPIIFPANESKCGAILNDVRVCLWRRGPFAAAQFSKNGVTTTAALIPYAKDRLPQDGSIIEGWWGTAASFGNTTPVLFRLGLTQASIPPHESTNFVFDVSYARGIWVPAPPETLSALR